MICYGSSKRQIFDREPRQSLFLACSQILSSGTPSTQMRRLIPLAIPYQESEKIRRLGNSVLDLTCSDKPLDSRFSRKTAAVHVPVVSDYRPTVPHHVHKSSTRIRRASILFLVPVASTNQFALLHKRLRYSERAWKRVSTGLMSF